MHTNIFQYIYVLMMGVCAVSVLLWVGMQGPLGVEVSYVSQGAGMVLMVPVGEIVRGEYGAFNAEMGGVTVQRITGSLRRDGELQYYTSLDGVITELFPASTLAGRALVTVPLMGLLVHAIGHPIGFMAFVGSPLVMVLVNMLQRMAIRVRRMRTTTTMGAGLRATTGKKYSV